MYALKNLENRAKCAIIDSKVRNEKMRGRHDGEREIDPKRQIMFRQIGAKVAYYRTLRDLSQKELAKRINMSASTIGKVERGQYNDNLSLSLLLDIADGLQIDVTLLTTFTDLEKRIWWESLS